MRIQHVLASSIILLCAEAFAQSSRTFTVSPPQTITGGRFSCIDLGDTTVYVFNRTFGSLDSFRLELNWTDHDLQSLQTAAYCVGSSQGAFGPAIAFDGGFLLSGSFSSQPFMVRLDASGGPVWAHSLAAASLTNMAISLATSTGTSCTGYTSTLYPDQNRFCRIHGESDGGLFTGVDMSSPLPFRVYTALPTDDPDVHYISGDLLDPAWDGFLMKVGPGGCQWMKRYDLGAAATEGLGMVRHLSDGNLILAGFTTDSGGDFDVILMKADTSGAVIWCKRYGDASDGLYAWSVYELPDGNLYLAARDAQLQGVLMKVDAQGALIWTHRLTGGPLLNFSKAGMRYRVHGRWTLYELDDDDNTCDVLDLTNPTVSDVIPVVQTVAVTNTPFSITTTPIPVLNRPAQLSWALTCTTAGVPEVPQRVPLTACPVPATGLLSLLSGTAPLRPEEHVRVRDITGALVIDAPYGHGIDLSRQAPGVYMVELVGYGQRVRILRE